MFTYTSLGFGVNWDSCGFYFAARFWRLLWRACAREPRRALRRPLASREQSGGNSRFLAPRENSNWMPRPNLPRLVRFLGSPPRRCAGASEAWIPWAAVAALIMSVMVAPPASQFPPT